MPLVREQNWSWSLKVETEADKTNIERSHGSYLEALPRYLTALDLAFIKAAETSEFAFISTLLHVRSLQDAGSDPYELIPALMHKKVLFKNAPWRETACLQFDVTEGS
jgi:hypothetical protein